MKGKSKIDDVKWKAVTKDGLEMDEREPMVRLKAQDGPHEARGDLAAEGRLRGEREYDGNRMKKAIADGEAAVKARDRLLE